VRLQQLAPQFEEAGLDIEKFRVFLSAERSVLAHALAIVDERWGGVDGYLTGPGALPAATLDRLRAALLDDR
jgi:hypothetical protein